MLFTPAYEYIAAELCREELDSVRDMVEDSYRQFNSKQIMDMLIAEHPLCLERDLLEAYTEVVAHIESQCVYEPPPHCESPPADKQAPEHDPEDPNHVNNTRWTPHETQRLLEYLAVTKGRKSWIKCAQYVGSRSSAQCKAKHNNMRAQEISRDSFEI
ncbi:hypothetical protein IWW55_001587 [Coemansia sp. RSA 2706]|nr:hypothetical protein LPJ63_003580 [Coemansia sp. RSA 2711]KAJ2306150.1 hypothetical protein IWW55_001587 [Coemansia sp. RSA 2706]KAJ2327973.1 hypothetical protein IWW51_001452 [Coemansia sp. RSA 2702]